MKKYKLIVFVVLAVLCCSFLLVGCSSGGGFDDDVGGGESGDIVVDGVNRKLVYQVRVTIKTADTDAAMKTIVDNANAMGGFLQNQEQSGNGSETDYAYLTVRIPTEKLDDFVNTLGSSGKILSKRVDMKDITTEYVNASAQKASLQNRKQLLENMLTTEGLTASDKIAIVTEISAVDTQLQALELQLNSYDSMVNFSTVTVSLNKHTSDVFAIIFSVFVVFAFIGLIVAVSILAVKLSDAKRKLKQ